MAMLASKSPYPAPLGGGSHVAQYQQGSSYRLPAASANQAYHPSPTESEFSESYEISDSVRSWDEARVADWLCSINCAQYVDLFRKNNITGEVLIEIDQPTLKEMGVKKIGDRVRIGSQAKSMRNTVYKRSSKRSTNRHSLAMLDGNSHTPPSSGSPRAAHSARPTVTSRADKRMSRRLDGSDFSYSQSKPSSRPSSPLVDQENRIARTQRYDGMSSRENIGREQGTSYFGQTLSNGKGTADAPQTSRFAPPSRFAATSAETPQTARFAGHIKSSPSMDHLATYSSPLPVDKALIRVIYDSGRSSVVSVEGCKTSEELILKSLKKGALNEAHFKSYCFWILDGTDPDPAFCRRLGDAELVRLCADRQLRIAAKIAEQQAPSPPAIEVQPVNKPKSKIERLTGEPLAAVNEPTSVSERKGPEIEGLLRSSSPTELITQDLTSYFPDVQKEDMDRTVRMSIRRSRRMSKAMNRLSMASNFSYASNLRDAPPLPTIADSWLNTTPGSNKNLRPLSIVRLGRSDSGYRDSVATSVLEPLDEESPLEPNRKSYVSFSADSHSGSDSNTNNGNLAVTDPDGNTVMQSYFDDTASVSPAVTENGGSLNSRLSQVIAEDSDEDDEELIDYLQQDSWENMKYMKGAMIGQGSFGTVYLALHAMTGELMAMKQVEMPSSSGTQLDKKKDNMVEALKREIDLLRELKHPNIVQYLGSNSDENHLNIFLEYVAGGSVATMLVNYGSLNEVLITNFVRQILTGLAYLHSKDIIHRDIKGANILVDNHGSVKISDFGISKRVDPTLLSSNTQLKGRGGPRVSLQGSVFWMAPEVVKQTAYTRAADIWSLGCLIVEMFTGSHPHPNCTQLQAIFKIGGSGGAKPDIPEQASKEAREFLERTFEIEHEKRPSADELLESPFCTPKA
ncbi:ATP binding [Taxawa tesnikishii (nom. ined.)]|nr:ATP binding [Dothideales sp. JES 119]